jgi:adenine deaminase
MKKFIHDIPKAELHIHIEGSLEPELMFEIGKRNNVKLAFSSVEEVKSAYNFHNLQSFLDIYYKGAQVLIYEQDFYDMTWAYLKKAAKENIYHTEIFFDPQTHTARGISFKTVIKGISRALEDAQKKLNISSDLIMCFLRHLSAEDAMNTLYEALDFKNLIIGVGLDSSEKNNPPEKFTKVFDAARKEGFLTVAHAGEEGDASYIRNALEKLKVLRIDHGVRCTEDDLLVEELKKKQVPLTVCPLSNVKLKVFNSMKEHNLKTLLDKGLCVTINSDDPAYFGGYLEANFYAASEALGLTKEDIYKLAKNSFLSSFITEDKKIDFIKEIDKIYLKK